MTLKYDNLVEFYKQLVGDTYPDLVISHNRLHMKLGMFFGLSDRQRKNAMSFLKEFGFIREGDMGRWEVKPMRGWEDDKKIDEIIEEKTQ